mmetsp:Transcript_563/g.750  ORF Transcript_563/g.750 Transcript_563/m.750 type:complete len:327 (+) Transcript_563:190-1170(+)
MESKAKDFRQITISEIMRFCESFSEGKLPTHFKSAPRPPADIHPLLPESLQVVTRSSFKELVRDSESYCLLLVHYNALSSIGGLTENMDAEGIDDGGQSFIAPIACLSLALANHLDSKNFKVCILDYEANDLDEQDIPPMSNGREPSPPYLAWFPRKAKVSFHSKKRSSKKKNPEAKKCIVRIPRLTTVELVKYVHKKLPKHKRFSLNSVLEIARRLDEALPAISEAVSLSLALAYDTPDEKDPLRKKIDQLRKLLWLPSVSRDNETKISSPVSSLLTLSSEIKTMLRKRLQGHDDGDDIEERAMTDSTNVVKQKAAISQEKKDST